MKELQNLFLETARLAEIGSWEYDISAKKNPIYLSKVVNADREGLTILVYECLCFLGSLWLEGLWKINFFSSFTFWTLLKNK